VYQHGLSLSGSEPSIQNLFKSVGFAEKLAVVVLFQIWWNSKISTKNTKSSTYIAYGAHQFLNPEVAVLENYR
jgi:hypothetical protein